jgi:cytochrome P450
MFTEEQFIVTSLDLFTAGSETTSNTLEFGILYMILNPEVQRKVQDEIESVVGFSRFPNMNDKPKLATLQYLHDNYL